MNIHLKKFLIGSLIISVILSVILLVVAAAGFLALYFPVAVFVALGITFFGILAYTIGSSYIDDSSGPCC